MFNIIRPLNCAITFITIFLATIICGSVINIQLSITAGFIGFLVTAGGNVINDIFDLNIDKINRPQRVLPSNKLTKKTAIFFYIFLTVTVFILSFSLPITSFIIVLTTIVLLFLYSYKLKSVPLLGNIAVSIGVGAAFLFGATVTGNISCGIIPSIFAFIISLMRELVKDIEDIVGDKKMGIKTFPIKYGIEKTTKLISFIGITLILLTTIPVLFKIYNVYYFLFVLLFVDSIIVDVIKRLKKNTDINRIKKISAELKIGMLTGIISIIIGISTNGIKGF